MNSISKMLYVNSSFWYSESSFLQVYQYVGIVIKRHETLFHSEYSSLSHFESVFIKPHMQRIFLQPFQ